MSSKNLLDSASGGIATSAIHCSLETRQIVWVADTCVARSVRGIRMSFRLCFGLWVGLNVLTVSRAKLAKYPNGYPGDVEPEVEKEKPKRDYKKPRMRIRYTCHNCSNLYLQGDKACSQCQHERCEDCKRYP